MENDICCPRLEPNFWEDKLHVWKDKLFVKGKIPTFLYMPIGFGKVMTKMQAKITEQSGQIVDNLCLSDHTSKWNMNIYLATNKEIEGLETIKLTGNYYSKVYEGPFQDTGKWGEDFDKTLKEKGYLAKKIFMWYTTCPKCAKKYGKNYVVFISQI